jgi:lipoprotein-anchoring transpeptidase ErfK/SrfK
MSRFVKFVLAALGIFIFAFVGTVLFFILLKSPKLPESPKPGAAATVVGAISSDTLAATTPAPSAPVLSAPFLHNYIEIINSCDWDFTGTCVNERSGPSTSSPVVSKLRNGIVLAVATDTVQDAAGNSWYRVIYDEWVRYPDRVTSNMYVSADSVSSFQEPAVASIDPGATTTISSTKSILIDRTTRMLYAYDGSTLFMKSPISTGLELTPTPRGTFTVYMKTPSRYMQGPVPGISDQYYDLPGVPWDLYFTAQGGAIHGAYWHNEFGQPWSHGCVNLPIDAAKKIYDWADIGTTVTVRD